MAKIVKYWTVAELQFLKDNYLVLSQKEIATTLKRSKKSVGHKLMRLGWSVSDEEHLRRTKVALGVARGQADGLFGENNPNWKGGVTKEPGRYARRFRAKYPQKHKAHLWVHYAVKHGKLFRQPCVVCGNTKSFAHHPDYSKPLEVVWLCRVHHTEVHYPKG